MSITQETLQKHLKDPAILCCRREKGTVIGAADLEDPGLFDDMQEAGLLTLSSDGLRIEQVIGRTLLQDTEALTSITKEVLDSVNKTEEDDKVDTAEVSGGAPSDTPVISSYVLANLLTYNLSIIFLKLVTHCLYNVILAFMCCKRTRSCHT